MRSCTCGEHDRQTDVALFKDTALEEFFACISLFSSISFFSKNERLLLYSTID